MSLAVVPPVLPGERLGPPAALDDAEAGIWRAIVVPCRRPGATTTPSRNLPRCCATTELGYKALSSEAHRVQRLNSTLHIADEFGEVVGPHSSLFEALATAAQRDVLTVVTSTQVDSHSDLLSTLIDDAIAGPDPNTIVSLYSAPKELDPFAESPYPPGQPDYDIVMNRDELLAMAAAARRPPAREPSNPRYCLNQRIEMVTPFVAESSWEAAAARWRRSTNCCSCSGRSTCRASTT